MKAGGGDDFLDGRWQLAAHVRSAEHELYLVCDALPARKVREGQLLLP